MTLIAIAHKSFSKERLALVRQWAGARLVTRSIAVNDVETCKPETLSVDLATVERMLWSLRSESATTRTRNCGSEAPFEIPRHGQLEVVGGFVATRRALGPHIDFEEHGSDRFAAYEFEVAIRRQLDCLGDRLPKRVASAESVRPLRAGT